MDFDVTDEQLALQQNLSRFCQHRIPMSVVRAWAQPGGFDRAVWTDLAGLGVFELATCPLDDVSGPLINAVLAYEVLGQALVPGPVLAASLASAYFDGVGDGTVVAAFVDQTDAVPVVTDLDNADVVLLLGADRVERLDRRDVSATRLDDPLDPTASTWLVEHAPDGEPIGDDGDASRLRVIGSLLVSAMLLGLGAAATDRAAEYARERRQFGRPIGAFQAVKHMLADSFARTEVARASLYAAALTADDPGIDDIRRATAGARYLTSRAATANARTAVQVFGGMGFTWEVDAHLYVRRAWALQSVLSSVERSLDAISAVL